jgi:hypothetical protein
MFLSLFDCPFKKQQQLVDVCPVGGDIQDCPSSMDLEKVVGPYFRDRCISAKSVCDVRSGGRPPANLAATIVARVRKHSWVLVWR